MTFKVDSTPISLVSFKENPRSDHVFYFYEPLIDNAIIWSFFWTEAKTENWGFNFGFFHIMITQIIG